MPRKKQPESCPACGHAGTLGEVAEHYFAEHMEYVRNTTMKLCWCGAWIRLPRYLETHWQAYDGLVAHALEQALHGRVAP